MRSRSLVGLLAASLIASSAPLALAHETGHKHHHGASHHSEHPNDHHGHSDAGIAIAIGAAALIGVAAAAKAHENNDYYYANQSYERRDNAIAACLHRAQRVTAREGGYGVTLRRVQDAKRYPNEWRVVLHVKQRLANGVQRYVKANCVVRHQQVQSFRWS